MIKSPIMIIGNDVLIVQRLSRHCLQQGAEVLPYYGLPSSEEITLFAPKALVFSSSLPEEIFENLGLSVIWWSELMTLQDLSEQLQALV
ncbi:hypothetical protein [Gloeothece verrucosa]|uniref:Uncharacterized protein n=1 Tax=Gloeothece verrucosa (strain PCC 7822) TaxID=497965 RepID=E0U782_GLOV7|nr:hypothetical protein [Gloeothece verrucosa]ADN12469.1 hypothetical protein Cyan7822_0424 [Gloeothece verrucosa PCC 7822]